MADATKIPVPLTPNELLAIEDALCDAQMVYDSEGESGRGDKLQPLIDAIRAVRTGGGA